MPPLSNLNFPIIYFNRFTFYVVYNLEKLTLTTKAGLRNKLFNNLTIIDSSGKQYNVKAARKLHGIGPLWGYNIFLNQKIKVELEFISDVQDASLEELKNMIFRNFSKDEHLWESTGDLEELRELVTGAPSIPSLIDKLGKILSTQYKV